MAKTLDDCAVDTAESKANNQALIRQLQAELKALKEADKAAKAGKK